MKRLATLLLLLGLLALTTNALAQTGYRISWWTVDGGGGASANGSYTLVGTIGQPDAGGLSNGDYILLTGFWPGGSAVGQEWRVYLPLVLRDT